MTRGRSFAIFLALSLMANAFCVPTNTYRWRRGLTDNQLDSKESSATSDEKESKEKNENHSSDDSKTSSTTTVAIDDDKSIDDDFDDTPLNSPSSSGGSNIFSLLNLASALFPASGSGGTSVKNNNLIVKKLIQDLIRINRGKIQLINKRQDIADNVIDIDYTADLKPPPSQKQEIDESKDSDSTDSSSEESDEAHGAEESVEKEINASVDSNSKQESEQASNNNNDDDDNNDSDYDEPPPGDGEGGGVLGLLAGLSGDGDSDLGTLLATVGGIIANLSGDGVDINAIIATALGLFVGLLSEGEQNPGEIIASYLLTSLDTITGGGANNNGAFFGKFLSNLVKGTSAAGDPDGESGSNEENKMTMADSAGFFASLLMALLGEMSKTSSGGSWR